MTEHFSNTRIEAMHDGGCTSENADAIRAKLEAPDRPTIRDELIENGENLGWCKPVYVGDLVFAQGEGQIVGVKWGDKRADREPTISYIMLEAAEHMLGVEAAEEATRGVWHDELCSSALAHALVWSCADGKLDVESGEMGCRDCPWFDVCPTLDDVKD